MLGSAGTAVSIAGGTIGATGVDVIACESLIGVGALLGAGSLFALQMDRVVVKKLVRSEKLVSLAQAKLFSIRDKASKALTDGKISENEFKEIHEEKRKYDMQRSDIMEKGKDFGLAVKKILVKHARAGRSTCHCSEGVEKKLKIVVNLNFNFPLERVITSAPPPPYEF